MEHGDTVGCFPIRSGGRDDTHKEKHKGGDAMRGSAQMRPVIPALGKYYSQTSEWGYLLLRVTAGLMLTTHVWPKLMAGPAAIAANVMARRGVEPALAAAYYATIVEGLGVILITLGLFTRPMALLLVIEFAVITKNHLTAAGWGGGGGAEFPFLWLIVFVAILLRGGGPYSLDARIGKEV
jgi:putative oxidoreductase